jgi:hypothetical protein
MATSSSFNYLPIGAKIGVSVNGRRAVRPEAQTLLPSIFEIVSPKPRSIILYSVCVTQLTPSRKDWVVERRYRDFNYLYTYLKNFGYDMQSYFPAKALFSIFMQDFSEDVSVNFLRKREKALNKWIKCLSGVLKNCNGKTREEIRKFLLPKALFISLTSTAATNISPVASPNTGRRIAPANNIVNNSGSSNHGTIRTSNNTYERESATLTNRFARSSSTSNNDSKSSTLKNASHSITRTPDSQKLTLVACGTFIAENSLECNKSFNFPVQNKNDVCVIIFSDGCYTRFRCRLLLKRLKEKSSTSFPISHKGTAVGVCYIQTNVSSLSFQLSSFICFGLYIVTIVSLGWFEVWKPFDAMPVKDAIVILFGLIIVFLSIYSRTLSVQLTVSDTPFFDDDGDEDIEKLKIEMKIQEYKALSTSIVSDVKFMLKTPESNWANVQQTKDGIKVCKYVSKDGWPHSQLLVRCVWFVKNGNAQDVVDILGAKDLETRNIFDQNCAGLNVVCNFEKEHGLYIVNNWQKDYFGGLISSREFVTLATSNEEQMEPSFNKQTIDPDDTAVTDNDNNNKISVIIGGSKYIDMPEFPETAKRPRAKILMGGSAITNVAGGCRVIQYGSVIVGGWVPDSVTHGGLIQAQIDVARCIKKYLSK